ncbi:hypothetical protein BDQ12DRAFT_709647 [Crucibulum laeve]|uniref:BTB domain-containing protein n=1 Tax=Crucibulum laeve TaxID=68775 RepID=A0A5C3MI05_9AGAR|nr:hypothetical protein BDQ12DRAFT_709647 [Crucibulum laeve]
MKVEAALRSPSIPPISDMRTRDPDSMTLEREPEAPSNSKRKHTEDDESDSVPSKRTKTEYKKHPRFWAPDGKLLIQYGETRMKLHQSRLASQSPWMERLFKRRACGPSEEDEEDKFMDSVLETVEVVDGVDMYTVTSDDGENLASLLDAMEDGIGFYYSTPSFPKVASIYRASCSFGFPKFLEFSQRFIKGCFPQRVHKITTKPIPHAACAVSLGRQRGLHGVLKRTFYELARSPDLCSTNTTGDDQQSNYEDESDDSDEDYNGSDSNSDSDSESDEDNDSDSDEGSDEDSDSDSDEDSDSDSDEDSDSDSDEDSDKDNNSNSDEDKDSNSVEDNDNDSRDKDNDKEQTFSIHMVSTNDLVRLLNAQKHLTAAWHAGLAVGLEECQSEACKADKVSFDSIVHEQNITSEFALDPICGFQKIMDIDFSKNGFCDECIATVKKSMKKQKELIWSNMDHWFALDK